VRRVLFRTVYGLLLLLVFLGGAWIGFRNSIVGHSVEVPNLTGKTLEEASSAAARLGLRVEDQPARARFDDEIGADRVLLQQPEAGSLAKPGQAVRLVLSLGRRDLRVPDLAGLPPRAAALRLAQESLQLGAVSYIRDPVSRPGILAQEPEADLPARRDMPVAVLTNRGMPETRFVMPDLVGQDADAVRRRLETFGFRVGSARFEAYEGVAPNTILKQFPPAGFPIARHEVVSLSVAADPRALPGMP
jgi:serine/threonine-protein kinase